MPSVWDAQTGITTDLTGITGLEDHLNNHSYAEYTPDETWGKGSIFSGSVIKGIGSTFQAMAKGVQVASAAATQRRQLESQAVSYDYQAKTASLNEGTARNNMYNAYQMGLYRSMQQGMVDAQNIAATRSANAHSGVRLNTGSKADVESSARLIKEMNRITNQQNTTSAAMKEYVNSANYAAQAIVAQGNAKAARQMQHGISPFLSGFSTMASSLSSSLMMSAAG